ncbi:unnamed protein product [Parascedosporium putredinis]|uniref:DNA-directed DNA polymerase n=1 Tax=Parascedosporium putredinis TaxID=1442378 RepID=A0A9P1GU34_9PEZI|nr:unnamed protein product [Parascedosporium putredinis]CAI7987390.1 unnamed protein product [Parascedosporium putredinis]
MVNLDELPKEFLQGPSLVLPLRNPPPWPLSPMRHRIRGSRTSPSSYKPLNTFKLEKNRSYKQQYGDMYFLRLVKIKPTVEKVAAEAWGELEIHGERVKKATRVLNVRQGELSWVVGTIYMDMSLKPNILEDVSNDKWLSAPVAVEKYYAAGEADNIMLEDDSGRVRLMGDKIKSVPLVTGCIIAVMGTETIDGEFDVVDIKFPDLAPSLRDVGRVWEWGKKVALVSGLSFSNSDASYSLALKILLEFILGEALDPATQKDVAQITRLILAGNSIAPEQREEKPDRKGGNKKYGYDASSYNATPFELLDDFLAEILPSIPVTLLPGADDPANAAYPQQPVHPAMFPRAREFVTDTPGEPNWFDCVTNPWDGEVEGWRFLGTGGQNVDDVFKYISSDDRIGMMEGMLRWRCVAPTAPDTLWSYPFQDDDPFVLKMCPHLYFVGSQPEFSTSVIHGPEGQSLYSALTCIVPLNLLNLGIRHALVPLEKLSHARCNVAQLLILPPGTLLPPPQYELVLCDPVGSPRRARRMAPPYLRETTTANAAAGARIGPWEEGGGGGPAAVVVMKNAISRQGTRMMVRMRGSRA